MKPPDFKALAEGSTGADGIVWRESRLGGIWADEGLPREGSHEAFILK